MADEILIIHDVSFSGLILVLNFIETAFSDDLFPFHFIVD
ncbi:hypothetical protein HMPREF1051_1859 [Neisseria sicca VK64]|uniref:Uncharacterized protein n=1 Tax=Neisseria sicca VK64 TaxID=1095748 RepID=I2NVM4_NEISI|nr:hypothetical protein HMPREF1051_1859 [Neisseria sicca VK64]